MFESVTPTSRSGPGRSRSARSSRRHATSPIVSRVVDPGRQRRRAAADREVRIAHLRRHRARRLALRAQVLGEPLGHAPELCVEHRRSAMSRSNVSSWLTETRSTVVSSRRGSIPRARSRSRRPTLPGSRRRSVGVVERGERADRLDAGRASRASAFGPTPGSLRTSNGARNAASRPAGHDGQPAGLAAVARHLGHDLARRDAERARQARRAAHGRLHRLGHAPRLEEVAATSPTSR